MPPTTKLEHTQSSSYIGQGSCHFWVASRAALMCLHYLEVMWMGSWCSCVISWKCRCIRSVLASFSGSIRCAIGVLDGTQESPEPVLFGRNLGLGGSIWVQFEGHPIYGPQNELVFPGLWSILIDIDMASSSSSLIRFLFSDCQEFLFSVLKFKCKILSQECLWKSVQKVSYLLDYP